MTKHHDTLLSLLISKAIFELLITDGTLFLVALVEVKKFGMGIY